MILESLVYKDICCRLQAPFFLGFLCEVITSGYSTYLRLRWIDFGLLVQDRFTSEIISFVGDFC